jgi:hypothetical protein
VKARKNIIRREREKRKKLTIYSAAIRIYEIKKGGGRGRKRRKNNKKEQKKTKNIPLTRYTPTFTRKGKRNVENQF